MLCVQKPCSILHNKVAFPTVFTTSHVLCSKATQSCNHNSVPHERPSLASAVFSLSLHRLTCVAVSRDALDLNFCCMSYFCCCCCCSEGLQQLQISNSLVRPLLLGWMSIHCSGSNISVSTAGLKSLIFEKKKKKGNPHGSPVS